MIDFAWRRFLCGSRFWCNYDVERLCMASRGHVPTPGGHFLGTQYPVMTHSSKCNQTRITLFALALAAFMALTQAEVLSMGSSAPVSVTFYEEPGMYASKGHGQCG